MKDKKELVCQTIISMIFLILLVTMILIFFNTMMSGLGIPEEEFTNKQVWAHTIVGLSSLILILVMIPIFSDSLSIAMEAYKKLK